MSVRTRFLIFVGVVLVVLAAATTFLPQRVRATEYDQVDSVLTAAVPTVMTIATTTGTDRRSISLSDVYAAERSKGGSWMVLARPLTSPKASPRVPTTSSTQGGALRPVTVPSARGSGSWRAVLVTRDGQRLLVAVPFDNPGASDGILEFVLVFGRVLLLVMVALVGWWLLRVGLRPIREVTRVATAISSGNRSQRLTVTAPGTEGAKLAQAFNEMLDQQHAAEDQLRRFIADASHELRTPVAAISGFADLYRHDAIADNDLDEVMRRIGQESARMRDLVEDMLLLARLDQRRPTSVAAVDLVQLAHDAALDASATHPSRTVSVTAGSEVSIDGDEHQLRQMISNLVNNSLAYTAGPVKITIAATDTNATVRVADDGPGLARDATDRVFDRFWRAPGSRKKPGSGLGLPIVLGIAEAHDGSLDFTSSPATGTTVTVTLPRRQETNS